MGFSSGWTHGLVGGIIIILVLFALAYLGMPNTLYKPARLINNSPASTSPDGIIEPFAAPEEHERPDITVPAETNTHE